MPAVILHPITAAIWLVIPPGESSRKLGECRERIFIGVVFAFWFAQAHSSGFHAVTICRTAHLKRKTCRGFCKHGRGAGLLSLAPLGVAAGRLDVSVFRSEFPLRGALTGGWVHGLSDPALPPLVLEF